MTKEDYQAYVESIGDMFYDEEYWDDWYSDYWNSAYLEESEKQKAQQQEYRYFKWEPIEWKVLANETEEGTLFVMAKIIINKGNPGGMPVYLLSDEEAKNADYGFENTTANSNSRVISASDYAAARGAAVYNKSNLICSWCLRTPGQSKYVKNVSMYGGIYDSAVKYYTEYLWNPNTSGYERPINGCVLVMHVDASYCEGRTAFHINVRLQYAFFMSKLEGM